MAYLGAFGTPDANPLTRPGDQLPPLRIERHWLPSGDLGIWVTVEQMRRLVRESVYHPRVREVAVRAIAGNRPDDSEANARSIAAWLQDSCPYVRDPFPCEYLIAPWVLLSRVDADGSAGCDCDCVSTLGAALLSSIGLRPVFTVLANGKGTPPETYNHVLTRASIDGKLVSVDPFSLEGCVEQAVRYKDIEAT